MTDAERTFIYAGIFLAMLFDGTPLAIPFGVAAAVCAVRIFYRGKR